MTSQLTGNPIISKLTLSLMEDSGWYEVNYSMAQFYEYGKDKGCSFLDDLCSSKENEICQEENAISCSEDFSSKTLCAKTFYSNGCLMKEYISQYMCSSIKGFI